MSGRLHRASLIALGICIGLLIAASLGVRDEAHRPGRPLRAGLIRAQVVIFANGQDSEINYSRGRIVAVTATSITLKEKDGQIEHFDVAGGARITLGNAFVALSSLHRGMQAQVFRPGDAPANRIDAAFR